MGSPNESPWLSIANVTFQQKATEILNEIPLRLAARASASLLAQQKFDKLRMTYSGVVCYNRLFLGTPGRSFPTNELKIYLWGMTSSTTRYKKVYVNYIFTHKKGQKNLSLAFYEGLAKWSLSLAHFLCISVRSHKLKIGKTRMATRKTH